MISTRVGIVLFVLAVAAGPLYTVSGYSAVGNLVSELAAQNTPRNVLMSGAFVALGVGIVVDGLRPFAPAQAPFIGFGVFMALAGLFGHRPISSGVPYAEWAHTAHSALATAAGISITVAFVWQAVRQLSRARRAVAAALAVALPCPAADHAVVPRCPGCDSAPDVPADLRVALAALPEKYAWHLSGPRSRGPVWAGASSGCCCVWWRADSWAPSARHSPTMRAGTWPSQPHSLRVGCIFANPMECEPSARRRDNRSGGQTRGDASARPAPAQTVGPGPACR